MSSTSVHSNGKKKRNEAVVCGLTIADEKGKIDIPPKTASKGPSTLDVRNGEIMEILAESSELHRDGTLTMLSNGVKVASYSEKAFKNAEKKALHKQERTNKKGKTSKPEKDTYRE